jgi:hypothetical protein
MLLSWFQGSTSALLMQVSERQDLPVALKSRALFQAGARNCRVNNDQIKNVRRKVLHF